MNFLQKIYRLIPEKNRRQIEYVIQLNDEAGHKNLANLAAGTGYFMLLALFPALAIVMTLLFLALDTSSVSEAISFMANTLPKDVANTLAAIIREQATHSSSFWFAMFSFGVALFGASKASRSFQISLNTIYEVEERRNFFVVNLVAILFILVALLAVSLSLVILVFGNDLLRSFLGEGIFTSLIWVLRWPILFILVFWSIMLMYRYLPDRTNYSWRDDFYGALFATVVWILITMVFLLYSTGFAVLTSGYTVFAGIIGIMIWFDLSATTLFYGALINQFNMKRNKHKL